MAQATKQVETLSEATIRGKKIQLGQRGEMVEQLLQPGVLADPNRNKSYGSVQTARYVEDGWIYILTFGPPAQGSGPYVVTRISRAKAQS